MQADTTTLAPTDEEIWREWELILATSNPTTGTAAIKLVRTAIAKWGAPAQVTHPSSRLCVLSSPRSWEIQSLCRRSYCNDR